MIFVRLIFERVVTASFLLMVRDNHYRLVLFDLVKIESFPCIKKLILLGSKGLTKGYLPYTSDVWVYKTTPYITNKVLFKSIQTLVSCI